MQSHLKMSNRSKKGGKPLKVRRRRTFSEEFKRQKVELLISKQISVQELSVLYSVSKTSIYRWLYRYSPHYNKGTIQVVQMESEAAKTKQLLERLAAMERVVGQKQMEIDYLQKMIELASESLKVDIKKNFDTRPSNGSANTSSDTPSP